MRKFRVSGAGSFHVGWQVLGALSRGRKLLFCCGCLLEVELFAAWSWHLSDQGLGGCYCEFGDVVLEKLSF